LTNQLVQLQKERLVNKGTALTDLINKIKTRNTTKTVLPTTKSKAQEKVKKKQRKPHP
jgi:hypothetical protein